MLSSKLQKVLIAMALSMLWYSVNCLNGASYNDIKHLYLEKFGENSYVPEERPVKDTWDTVHIRVTFDILSILDIDEVKQSFTCSGYVLMFWTDQIVAWESDTNYSSIIAIHPHPSKVWMPRIELEDNLDDSNPFEKDGFLTVYQNGTVNWAPSAQFSVTCPLDMSKYPFDEHTCTLLFRSSLYTEEEVQFLLHYKEVVDSAFVENDKWKVVGLEQKVGTCSEKVCGFNASLLMVKVKLKRRPTFVAISIIYPVIVISFLSTLVFILPPASGERIGYGITVLLSLFVFLGLISSQLPSGSRTLPALVIYMACLVFLSALSVVVSIVMVSSHHRNKKLDSTERRREKSAERIDSEQEQSNKTVKDKTANESKTVTENCTAFIYRRDRVIFFALFTIWLIATLSFILYVSV